ncbi:putative NRPS-like protein biosynthetic cluster [Ceratocystis pirilliformis]|uniref:NRPS-like protein biosynthetic cluster n=1 Tax=Ceratocystis pirilliformis TaxID=259994 RepID=A0ABR3Z682_9PEZI
MSLHQVPSGADLRKVPSDTAQAVLNALLEDSVRPAAQIYANFEHFIAATAPSALPDTLSLLRAYGKFYSQLPDFEKHRLASRSDRFTALQQDNLIVNLHNSYSSISDLMPSIDAPALRLPDGSNSIMHVALRKFVADFTLSLPLEDKEHHTVAVCLPNGPLLAASCLAVAGNYACAPINIAVGVEQFMADIKQAQAKYILTTPDVAEKLEMASWAPEAGVSIFYIEVDYAVNGGCFSVSTAEGVEIAQDGGRRKPNRGQDLALLLFTSGTSGTKKRVPLTMHMLLHGAVLVIDSWGLTERDICLNMMPLFHVGGLLRNIFAPILAGGSTVCCPAFDADLFWTVVDRIQPTWYYASPTMHDLIVKAMPSEEVLAKSRFRLICNAAGGLLPTLAGELKGKFKCTILPSYGMTECMPISTPPLTYKLEREGTSGISTGPDMAILDASGNQLGPMETGYINVRGSPVFGGYLKDDGSLDVSVFNTAGWFDTGDMGHMDADGYLYVTGRSKEVINRGGEIISPFEIEDAIASASLSPESPIFQRVKGCLAFSVDHEVLQEVVGVVLVTPPDKQRVDLKILQNAVASSLHSAKWPFLVVYMDSLPKSNNKIMRIKIAQRLGLPTVTDSTPYMSRHWEADCPPDNTPLSVGIPSRQCQADLSVVEKAIKELVPAGIEIEVYARFNQDKGAVETVIAPSTPMTPCFSTRMSSPNPGSISPSSTYFEDPRRPSISRLSSTMSLSLVDKVHNYMVPHTTHTLETPLPRSRASGMVDEMGLSKMLQMLQEEQAAEFGATTRGQIIATMAEVLDCSPEQIKAEEPFYKQGVDSLLVGQLASKLRSQFHVAIPSTKLYEGASPTDLAAFVDDALKNNKGTDSISNAPLPDVGRTHSSTNPFLLVFQLVPLCLIYPVRRALQWCIFMSMLASTETWASNYSTPGRLFNLVLCVAISKMSMQAVLPFVGIIVKWVVIGRYCEGLYPMWGGYHTRWWFVQKTLDICGLGFFASTDATRNFYYRIMGAKIGKNVKFRDMSLQEFDLVEIGDNVTLERSRLRPFAVERNTSMYLGKIKIGSNCTVGVASFIAPGAIIPDNTCIGPNSSSWEMDDADEGNRHLLASGTPGAHWALNLFLTKPLVLLAWIVYLLPWLAGLAGLVMSPVEMQPGWGQVYAVIHWFAAPHRVGYHFLALALQVTVSPIFVLLYAALIRVILDGIFGRLTPSTAANRSAIDRWRMDLVRQIMPIKKMLDVTNLFGSHYEMTSRCMRLMGAKVGRRVYWPGTGPKITDYHLIDIGDDVVFGSRSNLITSDAIGSDYIKIGNGAMIADRVILLPGVEVGCNTLLGSGAMTRRNGYYADGMTYAGAKKGDCTALAMSDPKKMDSYTGTSRNASSESTATEFVQDLNDAEKGVGQKGGHIYRFLKRSPKAAGSQATTPFGRAFYCGEAPYHVLGQFVCAVYNIFFAVFTKAFWNAPTVATIQIVDRIYREAEAGTWRDRDGHFHIPFLLGFMAAFTVGFLIVEIILVFIALVSSKWILMGRRQPGNYDWDKSSYCQRWQIYLAAERLRRQCMRGHGILGMLTGTYWLVLFFKALGAKIGKDCALFAGGTPTLYFTEPDLLTLGDRVAIDDASLVGHINSRGKFNLNRLSVGDRSVLRAGSRLLSGAKMEKDTCLLEHTLIMGGEIIEEGTTMQGWTGERFSRLRVPEHVTSR